MHKSEFNSSIKNLWVVASRMYMSVEQINVKQIHEVAEGGFSVRYGFTYSDRRTEFFYWSQVFRTEREARKQAIHLLEDQIQHHKERLTVSRRMSV